MGAVLITDDLDFGELVFRRRLVTSGVLLLRLAGMSCAEKSAILNMVIAKHGEELPGRFSVLDPRRIRIRPLGW